MADLATIAAPLPKTPARAPSLIDRKLKARPSRLGLAVFVGALSAGLGYIVFHVSRDLDSVKSTSAWPYMLLGLALIIALGFEFVNGFHDTANAVATVIYTNSLEPHVAVVWSGLCNLAGVLASSGAVAFAIITLLPVDLILQVSSGAGFAMVFALLIAAILWNLGTWWLGLPASSSHTMVGSIIGVGVANQLMSVHSGTSGVDWEQATKVFKVLLISPIIGFTCAALLMLYSKYGVKSVFGRIVGSLIAAGAIGFLSTVWFKSPVVIGSIAVGTGIVVLLGSGWVANYPALFEAPKDNTPPPLPIRALLILTCSGVSFSHGSNDGQKGMGLIMLILIGTVPTAYALNHAVTGKDVQAFVSASDQ